MKKQLFILLSSFLITTAFSQTDVYHPLPQGWGAKWYFSHQSNDGSGGVTTYSTSVWSGDTTINSVNYTKAYSQIGANLYFSGGIRQNVPLEKAYVYHVNTNSETDISFNQHLQEGDTVYTTILQYNSSDTVYIVTEIDSIPMLGNYRKRFHLQAENMNQAITMGATYVAGIGYTSNWGWEWGSSVQCFLYENNLVIGDALNPGCSLSNQDLIADERFMAYPNPTSGQLKLNKIPEFVRLYASDGKQIPSDYFQLVDDKLDLNKCAPGIYQGHFEFTNGVVVRKITKL